jgi:hypothetical protein
METGITGLVRGVAQHEVQQEMDAPLVGGKDELAEILYGSIIGGNRVGVDDVAAEIAR